jgi:hypothetical protein
MMEGGGGKGQRALDEGGWGLEGWVGKDSLQKLHQGKPGWAVDRQQWRECEEAGGRWTETLTGDGAKIAFSRGDRKRSGASS